MTDRPHPEPHLTVRLTVIETPVPGVLLGHVRMLLPQPTDPVVGYTTTEDGQW